MSQKPVVKLTGTDGNIFALLGKASSALKRAGLKAEADKMVNEIVEAGSYDEALNVIMKYVDAE